MLADGYPVRFTVKNLPGLQNGTGWFFFLMNGNTLYILS
jgi:hypothetical protein